jgi:hypothetical protein
MIVWHEQNVCIADTVGESWYEYCARDGGPLCGCLGSIHRLAGSQPFQLCALHRIDLAWRNIISCVSLGLSLLEMEPCDYVGRQRCFHQDRCLVQRRTCGRQFTHRALPFGLLLPWVRRLPPMAVPTHRRRSTGTSCSNFEAKLALDSFFGNSNSLWRILDSRHPLCRMIPYALAMSLATQIKSCKVAVA